MNNMPSKKSIISLAIGSAVAVTLGTVSIASANESPFATQFLNKGYMVAEYHAKKDGDGYGDKKSGEGRCGMSMADTDKDGRVSKEEHARHCQMMFDKMDANKDGFIDKDEASKMTKKHGHRSSSGDRSHASDGYGSSGPNYRTLQHMKPMGQ